VFTICGQFMQTRFVIKLILFVDERLTGSTKILVLGRAAAAGALAPLVDSAAAALVPLVDSAAAAAALVPLVDSAVLAVLKGTKLDSETECSRADDERDVADDDDGTVTSDSDSSDASNTGSDFITVKRVSSVSAGT